MRNVCAIAIDGEPCGHRAMAQGKCGGSFRANAAFRPAASPPVCSDPMSWAADAQTRQGRVDCITASSVRANGSAMT